MAMFVYAVVYQFELRDCSHIFSCHKEAGISLAKKYKSFKFTVATGSWLHLSPVANLGRRQGGSIIVATRTGHITKQHAPFRVATGEHHHLTVAIVTEPACQRPNVTTKSSKFSLTSLYEMKTDDVKNSYCLPKQ
jgi:hypothetical protein